ncbi:MAG: sialidase family protein [Eubacteriales bacterium]|nr:sialidase family protein [Eubacteriales bacterium]
MRLYRQHIRELKVHYYIGLQSDMLIVHTYNGECPYKELQTFVSYTDDNGETWSNPVSIAPYANGLCIRKGIKMSNGETLFPIYHTHLNDGFGEFPEFGSSDFWINTYHSCGVIISADNGKSYMPYGNFYMNNNLSNNAVDPEGNFGTSLDLWEPNCVEVESGHIVMYMRSSGVPYIISAESFDFGRTWIYKGNTNIPNANSKISLQTIRDKVLMVSNTCTSLSFNERRHLQINISADQCRTWMPVSYIEGEDGHFFYPHIAVDEENEIIYIAYEDARRHYVAKYTFSELGL